jgi:2-keto-4-pentenoate hydratase/2-oxohepta-3-ene-1,7-dioic acid hydratase in catechol pathway
MRLATVLVEGSEELTIVTARGLVLVADINREKGFSWPARMGRLIREQILDDMSSWYRSEGRRQLDSGTFRILERGSFQYAPLYRSPPKIWGIGLNYADHAADLSERPPTAAPASFMKPYTTIIGHGDTIRIPRQSQRTTAEAELGIVIGKPCKDVAREDWLDVVAGFTTIIDMTAEDILRQNPRYLTMSKSFDTFFSFGPQLVTPDEIDDVNSLEVATIVNDRVHARNTVDHMTFPPDELVAFHSHVMTLLPGDIISTGTPGATPIVDGDTVSCSISGFEPLVNSVVDLKNQEDL